MVFPQKRREPLNVAVRKGNQQRFLIPLRESLKERSKIGASVGIWG
jgi:hypothetical protein